MIIDKWDIVKLKGFITGKRSGQSKMHPNRMRKKNIEKIPIYPMKIYATENKVLV